MNYLLDTHVAIWTALGDTRLPNTFMDIINNATDRKFISIVSIWEVAVKINIGKLDFQGGSKEFAAEIKRNGFEILPVRPKDVFLYEKLPLHHRDPFDRILIAAAVARDIVFLSCDKNMLPYTQNGLRILDH